MILDRIDRLPLYEAALPGAAALLRLMGTGDFDPDDDTTHAGYVIRHKQYETRADEKRLFEVHDRTIDLMICLSGAEVIHLCGEDALLPGAPLPGGADGRKLVGGPRGSAVLLAAGMFIAIAPGEAHMVAGQVDGACGPVDKLVVKLPAPARTEGCACVSECARHGSCAQCVAWHRTPDNSLPTCLREKGQAMIHRALRG